MNPQALALILHRNSFDWMWFAMESMQRQNEALIWTCMDASPVPIGDRARSHTQKWMDIFQRGREDARDTGHILMGHAASRMNRRRMKPTTVHKDSHDRLDHSA